MKKYFADILSIAEVICAILVLFSCTKGPSNWALWLFCLGELCDALDGPCARRWPYPRNEYHWWRDPDFVQRMEHISDILLLCSCAGYLMRHGGTVISRLTLVIGGVIAAYCLWIEFDITSNPAYYVDPDILKRVILHRRKIYLIAIALGVLFMILATSYSNVTKTILVAIGLVMGCVLIQAKVNRLREP